MRIGDDKLQEVLRTADLVEVIGEYVQLKRRGQSYVGLSPFKNEKTPSFYVTPSKGIFKDFSSGKGGDVVSFLMEKEGFTFVEAVQHLAKRYGIELPAEEGPQDPGADQRLQSLRIFVQWAADWYREQLLETEAGRMNGLGYFREREFNDETLKAFGVGYAPEAWDGLWQAAQKAQFNPDIVLESGLCKVSEKRQGSHYDLLRDRVIFPLHDAMSRVVGVAGRVLTATSDGVKYINSPESLVYHKSQILYALHLAKDAIRQEDECLLLEGYTDVMRLHQEGVKNAVASAGTAFTVEQARLIARYTKKVTIVYDGDKAGIAATLRATDVLLAEGFTVHCLLLPEGHDPDSYTRKFGSSGFRTWLREKKQHFLAYRVGLMEAERPTDDPTIRAERVHQVAEVLATLPDEITRQLFIEEAGRLLRVEARLVAGAVEQRLRQQMQRQDIKTAQLQRREAEAQQSSLVTTTPTAGLPAVYSKEREIIRLMLNHYDQHLADGEGNVLPLPQWLDTALANVPFETPVFARLRQLITDASKAGGPLPVEQLLHQNGTETGTMVAELLTRTHQLSPNWQVKTDMPIPQEDENLTRSIESVVLHLEMLSYDRLERENRENLRQIEEQLFRNAQEPEADLLRDWTDTLELYKFLRETSAETHTRLGIVAKKMRGD